MTISETDIAGIVERVVSRVQSELGGARSAPARGPTIMTRGGGDHGVFGSISEAIGAAEKAFMQLGAASLETRAKMIEAMRKAADGANRELAEFAVRETGLGRVEDKLKKNANATWQSPGLEDVQPIAVTGDHGLMLTDWAPYGVIGSITPTTNPTETIICNAIGMIAAGNSVVFNVHPGAKKVSARTVSLLNDAMAAVGGPQNLLTCVAEPTIESAGELMKHPKIALLVVTGGPAVVKAAMNSGKKAICAGPGNPPVVVDRTADLKKAARDIYLGASLDNNIVCIVEKEIIAEAAIADELKKLLRENGAHLLSDSDVQKLEKVLIEKADPHHPVVNKKFVGKDAAVIAKEIGLRVDPACRLLFCEVASVAHSFVQAELLMPVIPLVRVPTVEEAIGTAVAVEHGFRHTAVIHSKNIDHMHLMARAMNCSIFVKNGPSFAGLGIGGEGYTSYTIASPTGEGLTSAKNFVRARRCTLTDRFRIV
ncbi:MAG: aldehyde dehydrogenase EutE [Deltaproteobacteria bacterium]|nr:aldehyde dehydrogenase EutE [Deltaproteobacteria bacterium]